MAPSTLLCDVGGCAVTQREVIAEMLGLECVSGAAFISADGEVIEEDAKDGEPLASSRGVLKGYLSSLRSLAESLGDSEVMGSTLECEDGTLLVTRLYRDEGAPFSVVAFRPATELGVVRFRLRRLLPKLEPHETPA